MVATHELIELYLYKLHAPRRAIPELERIRMEFPESIPADAAAAELDEFAAMLANERQCGERVTQQFLRKIGIEADSPALGKDGRP